MLSNVQSGAINGLDAIPIHVEVDYNPRRMAGFTIVGLPDTAIQESRERVRSAIKNRGLDFPNCDAQKGDYGFVAFRCSIASERDSHR